MKELHEIRPHKAVFEEAIGRAYMNFKEHDIHYVYDWSYMGHDINGEAWFQHFHTKKYIHMPAKSGPHFAGERPS